MEKKELELKYWFSHAWYIFKNNLNLMISGAIIFILFSLASGLLENLSGGLFFRGCTALVIAPPLTAGWWFLCLRLARGQSATLSDILAGLFSFSNVWVAFVSVGLLVSAGYLLFLIPGIIWYLKYHLSLFVIMDKQIKPFKAIKYSGQITYGYKIKLLTIFFISLVGYALRCPFAFYLSRLGSNKAMFYLLVGTIPYLLSSLVLVPWSTAALATAYDALSKRYNES